MKEEDYTNAMTTIHIVLWTENWKQWQWFKFFSYALRFHFFFKSSQIFVKLCSWVLMICYVYFVINPRAELKIEKEDIRYIS